MFFNFLFISKGVLNNFTQNNKILEKVGKKVGEDF
jgi:hypothetical protein